MRWNRMHVVLQADQRPKQNHNDEILPAHPQEQYLLVKEFGPMLNLENIPSPIIKCRRKWFFFFVMEVYPEKMVEQLTSGESETIFRNISCVAIIGLTTSGRKAWQEEEETRKEFSIVLILQEKFFIPDDFFKYIYHVGCAINLHSIINSGLIPLGQILSNRQTVFLSACGSYGQRAQGSWHDRLGSTASCTIHAWSMEETSKHAVLGRHQSCSDERIGSFIRHVWPPPFFTKHAQLFVSRRLFGRKLEEKVLRHFGLLQRFLWNMIGWRNWVQ